LPPADPGNLLDLTDASDFLTFHGQKDRSGPEVYAGCCDALIVYAAEANKKSKSNVKGFARKLHLFLYPFNTN